MAAFEQRRQFGDTANSLIPRIADRLAPAARVVTRRFPLVIGALPAAVRGNVHVGSHSRDYAPCACGPLCNPAQPDRPVVGNVNGRTNM